MTFDKSLLFLASMDYLVSKLTLCFAIATILSMELSPKVVKNQWFYHKAWTLLSKVVHIFAVVGHRRK